MLWVSNTDVVWTVCEHKLGCLCYESVFTKGTSLDQCDPLPEKQVAGESSDLLVVLLWEFSDFSKQQCPSGTPSLARNIDALNNSFWAGSQWSHGPTPSYQKVSLPHFIGEPYIWEQGRRLRNYMCTVFHRERKTRFI